jgi:hypothetical protein
MRSAHVVIPIYSGTKYRVLDSWQIIPSLPETICHVVDVVPRGIVDP